jgi:phosphoadenosine phosphosulfate reductase
LSTPASIFPRHSPIATSFAPSRPDQCRRRQARRRTVAAEDPEKFLFASDPDRCCDIRKVRPLAAALEGYDAWITGRKGFQSADRARLPLFEAEGDRIKINPLVGWSAKEVLGYIAEAGLPRHPLAAKGFPSIGCLPCTSSVWPGEDERAGRWRTRGKVECGIHVRALHPEPDLFDCRGKASDFLISTP